MKQITHLIGLLLLTCFGKAQVEVVGKNYLNNVPLNNTSIVVKQGTRTYTTLETGNSNEFKFEVDFSKVYRAYLYNAKSPVMFFEIVADNIPKSRYDYGMNHTFDLVFYDKNDPAVDTTVFAEPFYRIVYDGKKHMIDDSAYSRKFEARILKKTVKAEEPVKTPDKPSVFAGKVFLDNDKLKPLKNKHIYALDQNGKVIKSSSTNRFGAFTFTGLKAADVAKIKMDVIEDAITGQKLDKGSAEFNEIITGNLGLYSSKSVLLQFAKAKNNLCIWDLTRRDAETLADENYTSQIGGKLVSSSSQEKKFFANKTVYLSNGYNTVISKTKTNMLGSFVFEDIKPDQTYVVGVDKTELKPGEKIDLLNKDDSYIATLDSTISGRASLRLRSDFNPTFNKISIEEGEMKMDIKATIYGDNVNHPIGKLKIVLLNDNYQPIDSVVTDNFGAFKFKYLPFLKRFYLTAENNDAVLDEFKNILIYSGDQNLVKVLTHQKGKRFTYHPVNGEVISLRDLEMEDPWLEFVSKSGDKSAPVKRKPDAPKAIIENILFETNKYEINNAGKAILDKIILVMNTNKELKIEVGAHTDCIGSTEANLALSENRAKAVMQYMTAAGIDAKRIDWKGYGESRPLNGCSDGKDCPESEHAKNRRIEFKILGE